MNCGSGRWRHALTAHPVKHERLGHAPAHLSLRRVPSVAPGRLSTAQHHSEGLPVGLVARSALRSRLRVLAGPAAVACLLVSTAFSLARVFALAQALRIACAHSAGTLRSVSCKRERGQTCFLPPRPVLRLVSFVCPQHEANASPLVAVIERFWHKTLPSAVDLSSVGMLCVRSVCVSRRSTILHVCGAICCPLLNARPSCSRSRNRRRPDNAAYGGHLHVS